MYETSGDIQASQLAERLYTLKHKLNNLLTNSTNYFPKPNNSSVFNFRSNILQIVQYKMSAKRPIREPRRSPYLENLVNRYEERNIELEERESELRRRLELMENMAPAIMMFNLFKMMKKDTNSDIASATISQLKRVGGKDRPSSSFKPKTTRKEVSTNYDFEEKIKLLEAEHKKSSCVCVDIDEKIKALETERNKLMGVKQDMERKVRTLETQLSDLKLYAPLGLGRPSMSSLMSGDYDI